MYLHHGRPAAPSRVITAVLAAGLLAAGCASEQSSANSTPTTTTPATTTPTNSTPTLTYATPGSHAVGYQAFTTSRGYEQALTVRAWYPAAPPTAEPATITYTAANKFGEQITPGEQITSVGRALADAPPELADEPYRLVVFSHGYALSPIVYSTLVEHYASHGYVVLAPEHNERFDGSVTGFWEELIDRPIDIRRTIDLAEQLTESGGPLAGHFGCPTAADGVNGAGFRHALDAVEAGDTWVKLSAPYRLGGARVQLYVDALLKAGGPQRLVWATDWPYVGHEDTITYAQCVEWLREWVPDDKVRTVILRDTPRELFGF